MWLLGADDLIESAEKIGIEHIFCGHTHQFKIYSIRNIKIHCAGTCTCIKSNNDTTIHLIDISIENSRINRIASLNLVWDSDNQVFLPR